MSTMTVREMIHALRSNCREGILNSAIMASAGTGKTYQLAMRYIGLLLLGVEPEEIVAITFSKKAAGEIFEKIITQLIELIESEQKRLEAVRNGFLPANTTTEANLSGTLKKILASRRKLHIETNDSFLMQIIQGAPAEFGIAGEISMQDEEDDTLRQHAMLQALHSPMLSAHAKESREELYRILKSISFGLDKTTLYAEITELLKEYYPVYQDHPEEANWDMCDQPSAQALLGIESLKQIRESLEAALQKDHPEIIEVKPLEQKILDLMTNAELSAAGSGMRPEVDEATFFIDKGFLATPLPNSLSYYKKSYPVTPQLAEILHRLLSHIAAAELFAKQAKTHAVFQLMRLFQKTYDEQTQRAGKLVFSDILYLVNHLNQKDFGAAQVLQKRLDQKINHYLLDEFQDTSTNQWSAFQNLVEEVIQNMDPEVFRSFFMVGDIKQSIYQWRSGNPL